MVAYRFMTIATIDKDSPLPVAVVSMPDGTTTTSPGPIFSLPEGFSPGTDWYYNPRFEDYSSLGQLFHVRKIAGCFAQLDQQPAGGVGSVGSWFNLMTMTGRWFKY